MIDLSNVIALALGSDDVLQIQDAIGTVLWQKTIYYNVNISAGSNGTVSVNGVSGNYSQSVPSGTVLTIEGTGNTGYNFDEWSDGNTDNPRTITVTGDLTLTAAFESAAPAPEYFYVEDISGADNTLSIVKREDSAPTIEVFCSTDKQTWTSMGTTSTTAITATIPANGKLYLKCTANSWGAEPASPTENIMSASGTHNVGGSVMSLLRGDNYVGATLTNDERLSDLFLWDDFLISAVDLYLPPNTVDDCFRGMFFGCSNLTTPPVLPAKRMYWQCYRCMFFNCTSLTTPPALPAETLADSCYLEMFNGCTSLTEAPVLPATTLAASCYQVMFQGCSNLNSVTTYAQDISASSCLLDWLNSVAATGDFYNMACTTYPEGASGIPSGWTEHHTTASTINVTITNTGDYTGATYQIDSGAAQPINETGTTSFTVPATATTLTIHRNGKGVTDVLGICGYSEDSHWDAEFPVNKMTDNVSVDLVNLM